MEAASGLEYPFTMLFDEATDDGPGLPPHVATIYGDERRLPTRPDRPYTYVNFAASRDGRVSFNVPGHLGVGDVTLFNAQDCRLMALLRALRTLLCEGGPHVDGSLLTAGLVDGEFLTLCPQIIGNHAPEHVRPGPVEGAAFTPDTVPQPRPVSLRRAQDHLFLRSRFV